MPIYEFECQKCKAHHEVFQRVNDKPPTKCPKCGGRLERMISAPAIQFKGSGWYVTDYAGKSKTEKKSDEKGESVSPATTDKTEKKETPQTKKTSEKASSPKSPTGD